MTDFNADDILNSQTSGQMDTKYTPVPEGEWPANIEKVDARAVGVAKDKIVLDVTWRVDSPEVAAATGVDNPTVRQSIFLDMASSGGLDLSKGKNVQLGRLREAVGQNGPTPWAPGMLVGSRAIVKVSHRLHEGNTYAEVKTVAAA